MLQTIRSGVFIAAFAASLALFPLVGLPYAPLRTTTAQLSSSCYAQPAALAVEPQTAAPGSFFIISGSCFLPGSTVTITVNDTPVGLVLVPNSAGAFTFLIRALPDTPLGTYVVVAQSDAERAEVALTVDPEAATWPLLDDATLKSAPAVVLPTR
jgi:hypothetical protein